jgi:hypothetical protein
MWSSRLRSGSLTLAVEGVVRGCRRRRRKEEAEATLIKSRDYHLPGGEEDIHVSSNTRFFGRASVTSRCVNVRMPTRLKKLVMEHKNLTT